MTDPIRPFRDVLDFAIGGGWGKEFAEAGLRRVAVIRGTDFADVRLGRTERVPLRYEPDKRLARRVAQPGDLLLEVSGGSPTSGQTTGRSLLVTAALLAEFSEPVIPASFCRLVRVRSDLIDSAYAYYQLQDMYLSGRAGEYENQSTGISNFQFEYFLDAEVLRLPSLPEQRAIAEVLGALEAKIELNERMNATLDEMARALFKSWFVDFDPVRAKAEGRQPSHMDAATAALFPDSFEDSALGPIPAGWRVGTVGDEFRVTMGQSPPGTSYNEVGEGLPFFQGRRDFGFRFPTNRVYCTDPRRFADPGDTLVSVRAPVGDLNMAPARSCIGRGVAAVRHSSGAAAYTFHSMAAINDQFIEYEADGTVFGSINKTDMASLRVIAPPPAVVELFTSFAGPLEELVESDWQESRTLAELRDSLLPKLISGEIRVREAAREVEAAV